MIMLLVRSASPKIKTMEYFLPYNIRRFRQFLIHVQIITAFLLLPAPVSSLDKGPCKDLCEKHRPRGWSGEYELDCDKIAAGDQSACTGTCDDCPDSVCRGFSGSLFKCPSSELENNFCKQPCDKRSDVFKCTQSSYTLSELSYCQTYCKLCPDWVCNKNAFVYFCPVDKGQNENKEICQRNCHLRRFERYNSDFIGEFEFSCTEFSYPENERCRQDCRNACPHEICDPGFDDNRYNCPVLADRPEINSKPARTYEGRCKDRCDKFRSAGKEKYSLNCQTVFSSPREINRCNDDCERCPFEICSKSEINCPAVDNAVSEEEHFEEEKKENEKKHFKNIVNSDMGIRIGLIFLGLSVVLCIACCIFYCCTKSSCCSPSAPPPTANVTPGIGATPNAVYSGQGMMNPQPPSYTNSQASTINPNQHSDPVSQVAL